MAELCTACRARAHRSCDPLQEWCECWCFTGEHGDPFRVPEQRGDGDD